ncbi:MAG: ABC transporter permease subunit [Sphaerochaetaceae bacterium]
MKSSTWTTKLIVALSALLLLLLWQLAAVVLDAPIILPRVGPIAAKIVSLVQQKPFSLNLWATITRALKSFLIILGTGGILGVLAGYSPQLRAFLVPFLLLCKATPVMAVILLAFIWFTSGTVPLFSAFLMGFPVMYIQMEQGVALISQPLKEMCKVYHFSPRDRLFHLIIPSLAPSIITGAKASLAMVWKVVIASEVLTVPRYGVGSRMQLAQVNLETAEVLGWTLVAILLTALGDLLFLAMLNLPKKLGRIYRRRRYEAQRSS